MLELDVKHESLGTFRQSFTKITRPGAAIFELADQIYDGLLDKHIAASAFADLPAVAEFLSIRDRAAGMESELRRIELDRQAAELERTQLLAGTTTGEKLSVALSATDDKQRSAEGRLQAARSGATTFRANLARAEKAALDAIQGRIRSDLLAQIVADRDKQTEAARQRFVAAAGPILDELCALDLVSDLIIGRRDINERVDELLRTIKVPAPKQRAAVAGHA